MEILLIPVVAIAVGIYTYTKAKKNRMAQAIGAAFMPGLFFGALVWDIALVAIIIVLLYFGLIRFK